MLDARERAGEILEEKSTDFKMEELDFFMQVFGEWSQQLDKLLVTGAAACYARQAAYEKESAELREMQHRMMRAQEWLTEIKSTLPDQDTNTEVEEVCQETTPKQNITPLMDWFSREMSGLSLRTEKAAYSHGGIYGSDVSRKVPASGDGGHLLLDGE
jgi:hypothetical protein